VSTIGRDEKVIAEYIRNQERMDIQEDRQLGAGRGKSDGPRLQAHPIN
jgi:hypothetical protein